MMLSLPDFQGVVTSRSALRAAPSSSAPSLGNLEYIGSAKCKIEERMAISGPITRRLKPEEEEILRKREELTAARAALAGRELELVDLRSGLAAFEGRYLRQVGSLYAELDEWKARLRSLEVQLNPSFTAQQEADQARQQARQTYDAAHGEASRAVEFDSSPELKRLFRETAKLMHPDLAADDADRGRRTKFMAEANRAYRAGDIEMLQRILNEFTDDPDVHLGDGIGAELVRIIRQISQARERLIVIEQEMAKLNQSEIGQLRREAEVAQALGRDVLAEIEKTVRQQVQQVKEEYEALAEKAN